MCRSSDGAVTGVFPLSGFMKARTILSKLLSVRGKRVDRSDFSGHPRAGPSHGPVRVLRGMIAKAGSMRRTRGGRGRARGSHDGDGGRRRQGCLGVGKNG